VGFEPAGTSQRERYAINGTSRVTPLRQPEAIDNPLKDILRACARRLLARQSMPEVKAFLSTAI
jgi:putative transposase